mmetsp:Transcript_62391/g.75086  ORF Transcript_62391/g.75086 Transcript_62391/m.75086 type:complete len:281 (+) Transcript_62391:81-923(+)
MSKHEKNGLIRVPLSPFENLAVGAFGGAVETFLQMPLLTYKFCVQEGRALPTTIPAWYRGVAVQAGTIAPITAIQFMVNGILQKITLGGEKRMLTDVETIFTAASAGAISSIIYSPVDLITIQQQKLSLNPVQTFQHIMSNHGMSGIFRGISACAVRESIYTSGYLGLAPVVTSHLSKNIDFFDGKPFAANIMGACIAGITAGTLTHPIDTAKTVIQADLSGKQYSTARAAFPMLINEGGIPSLFKGYISRTVRICGAFFVCMSIREYALDIKTESASRA